MKFSVFYRVPANGKTPSYLSETIIIADSKEEARVRFAKLYPRYVITSVIG